MADDHVSRRDFSRPAAWGYEVRLKVARLAAGPRVGEPADGDEHGEAVAGAKAMSGNAHKIQIAKTAVKRAILKAAGLAVV